MVRLIFFCTNAFHILLILKTGCFPVSKCGFAVLIVKTHRLYADLIFHGTLFQLSKISVISPIMPVTLWRLMEKNEFVLLSL
jgi:hypothetical protein